MPQNQNTSETEQAWDASGRATDTAEAQGHAPEQITAIQLALVSMGYTLTAADALESLGGDGVDGQFGEATRKAILQFQDDTGLEPTGKLDEDTDEAILRAYGEALVASGGQTLFEDGVDALEMGESPADAQDLAAAASEGSIDDLVPGELPDEPVSELLDDVADGKLA